MNVDNFGHKTHTYLYVFYNFYYSDYSEKSISPGTRYFMTISQDSIEI